MAVILLFRLCSVVRQFSSSEERSQARVQDILMAGRVSISAQLLQLLQRCMLSSRKIYKQGVIRPCFDRQRKIIGHRPLLCPLYFNLRYALICPSASAHHMSATLAHAAIAPVPVSSPFKNVIMYFMVHLALPQPYPGSHHRGPPPLIFGRRHGYG